MNKNTLGHAVQTASKGHDAGDLTRAAAYTGTRTTEDALEADHNNIMIHIHKQELLSYICEYY